jgi:hypothetical protein
VSYSAASQVNDVYEGFLFSLVVDTARRSNATIHYEDVRGNKTHNLVFRTTPGRIYSRAHDYTHAVVRFGSAPVLEVHVGVQVQGSSGAMHECDVVVLDADEATLCRRERTFPRVAKCLLAIECKYYTAHLPLREARGFVGLSADMGNQAHSLFVANIASGSVTTYLTGRNSRKISLSARHSKPTSARETPTSEYSVVRFPQDFSYAWPTMRLLYPASCSVCAASRTGKDGLARLMILVAAYASRQSASSASME